MDGRRAVEGMLSSRCLAWVGPFVRDRRGWMGARRPSEGENENGTEHRRTRNGSSRPGDDMQMGGHHVYRI